MTNFVQDSRTGLPIGEEVAEATARKPGGEILKGRLVQLEPFDIEAHAAELHQATHGDDKDRQWLYMPAGPFSDFAAHKAYLEAYLKRPDSQLYAIRERNGGQIIGQASYLRVDLPSRVIEVGFILFTARLQRTPAATEAMYLMACHVFEDLHFRRYEWKCNALNAPSQRAASRLGFSYEGLFRQAQIVKGRNRDTAWFSMLDTEWPQIKAGFETWLSEENFDADGKQKLSLERARSKSLI